MALAPPYDKAASLVPIAITAIGDVINKLIAFIMKKVMELVMKASQLGKNVKLVIVIDLNYKSFHAV